MSSLPQSSILSMPPLERSHTEFSSSDSFSAATYTDRVSPRTYRGGAGLDAAAQYHQSHPQQHQAFGFLPTPPYTTTTPFLPYGQSYPVSTVPSNGQSCTPGHSTQSSYYGDLSLPTIPPRFSASNPINMPTRPTGCVSPLDLFGALPTAQSLPTNAMYPGAFGDRIPGVFAQDQTFLDEAVEVDEEVEAETTSALEVTSLVDSPLFSEVESMAEIEEMEEEPEVPEVPEAEVEKVERVKKGRKIKPAGPAIQPHLHGLQLASPPAKHKGDVETMYPEGEKGKEGKKRSRTAQACEKCRIRKARCFGGNPCNRCVKRKFVCEFTPTSTRSRPLVVKPEILPAATKPKARRHSMHFIPSAGSAGHARATTLPTPPVKIHAPRPARPTHHHSHSLSMNMPHPGYGISAVPPYLRPVAPAPAPLPSPSTSANTTLLGTAPISTGQSQPSLGFDDGMGLGLGLNLGLNFSTLAEDDDDLSVDPSPGGEGEGDFDPLSASGSSAPTSNAGTNSGSGAAGSDSWSSLFNRTDTASGTPNMIGDDDIFQFSPVQQPLQFEWDAQGPDPSVSVFGGAFGGYDAGFSQGFGMDSGMADPLAGGYMAGGEWFAHHQVAGFRV